MGNVHMEATQINYRGGSKKMSVEEAIKAAGKEITPEEKAWIDTIPELASQEIIAPEFDAESGVYAVGDLVIYNGGLYQFTTEHDPAGAWDAEEVAEVKVSDELSSLKSGLTNATTVSSGTITAQEGVTITTYTLQKSIKTVYLYMLVKFTPTLGTSQLLCVLPSGYRAQDRILFAGKNGTSDKLVTCEVDNWGAVRVHPTSDDSTEVPTNYYLTITYFTS